jgi:hypothetical protein
VRADRSTVRDTGDRVLWPGLPGANARAFYGLETEVGKVAEQSEVG